MSRAMVEVSPRHPPIWPVKASFMRLFATLAFIFPLSASLLFASGVACVLMSVDFTDSVIVGISGLIVAGTVQVVISIPKEAVRKALPTMAGLKTFAPSPPKTIFPIAIAKAVPIITAQRGIAGGSDSASSIAVRIALRSPRELGFFLMWLQINSVITAVTIQVSRIVTA